MGLELFIVTIFISAQLTNVHGHGYLAKPPARGSAWREGFDTPVDVTDNEENCGGFANQWQIHGGKCGICGDPWKGKKENETPGKYATGTIVEYYKKGQTIDVEVKITANHKGWFEFKLCENNNPAKDKTQKCFDKHLLEFENGETRAMVGNGNKLFKYRVKLPKGVTCKQCILQWHYNAGNSWGNDPKTGKGCIGCGPQESFWGCSDIAILAGDAKPPKTTKRPTRRTTTEAPTTTANKNTGNCKAVPPYDLYPKMNAWCMSNCPKNNCPASHCLCE